MMENRFSNNSVLVLSTESDTSTTAVLEWLTHFDVKFFRINYAKDVIKFINSNIEDTLISVNSKVINLSDFSAFWYRKGVLNLDNYSANPSSSGSARLEKHLESEKEDLIEFIYSEFAHNKKAITIADNVDTNKLKVLKLANQCGLIVPYTEIITKRNSVVKLLSRFTTIITKPISGSHLTVQIREKRYMTFTTKISNENLNQISDTFLPSTIQEYIQKKYEIRSFYFLGEFYSMVIFSQQTNKTSTDFRKYSLDYPNRTMPFKLPTRITRKLKMLMDLLHINTGSIDIIYSEDGRFVFLEVNPVGQFGMVSYPCNYNLEKRIAGFFNSNP